MPEESRVKRTPKNHMRKVLTGIKGSSTLETAARTSAYGDSLQYIVRNTWLGSYNPTDSSTCIAPLPSSPTYLLVDSPSTTEEGSWVRSKFGSFKCSLTNSASFWMSGILHVWRLLVAEVWGFASSMSVWATMWRWGRKPLAQYGDGGIWEM